MKDIIILTGSESLFSIVSFELSDMGYSVADEKDRECRLLIVDADDKASISELGEIKRKKTLCISRDPESLEKKAVGFNAVLRRPVLTSELRETVSKLFSDSGKQEKKISAKRERILLDPESKSVSIDSKNIKLSEKEFAVFSILLQNRGKAVSREMLADGIKATGGNEVDVYICYLRRKLEKNRKKLIFTERGVGYKII